jgi:hypothetical protein
MDQNTSYFLTALILGIGFTILYGKSRFKKIKVSFKIPRIEATIDPEIVIGLQPEPIVYIDTDETIKIKEVGFCNCTFRFLWMTFGEERFQPNLVDPKKPFSRENGNYQLPYTTKHGDHVEIKFKAFDQAIRESTYLCAYIIYNDNKMKRSKYELITTSKLHTNMSSDFIDGFTNAQPDL